MLATAHSPAAKRAFVPFSHDFGSPLGGDSLERRFVVGIACTYEPKEHMFCEGDVASHIYKIESGYVCMYRLMPDGRRQIIDFALPGDLIGLGAVGKYGANAQANTPTRTRCVPISWFRETIQQDKSLGIKLYEAMSHKLAAAQERLLTLGRRTAAERLADFLLVLARRNARNGEDPSVIAVPMTRTDIADYLGLTTETVSRTVTRFKTQGMVRLLPGGRIRILARDRLEALCQGLLALDS